MFKKTLSGFINTFKMYERPLQIYFILFNSSRLKEIFHSACVLLTLKLIICVTFNQISVTNQSIDRTKQKSYRKREIKILYLYLASTVVIKN